MHQLGGNGKQWRYRTCQVTWPCTEWVFVEQLAPGRHFQPKVNRSILILVHGLDDPGIIWESLGPILVQSGYQVWIMNYPNDQPIRDSANLFGQQLELFVGDEGPAPVAIVGHSMGGLVTREMLTNPNIGYEGKIKAGLVPAITRFII